MIPISLLPLASSLGLQNAQSTHSRGLPPPATPAQIAVETARVRDFVRATAVDRNGTPVLRALKNGVPRRRPALDLRGWRAYHVGTDIDVWVDPATGLVVSAGGGTNHDIDRPGRELKDRHGRPGSFQPPRRVTDEEAATIAGRYYAATGRTYGIKVYNTSDGAGGNGDNIAVDFLPTYRGVPFDFPCEGHIEIDRETGQLDDLILSSQEPPAPPADITANINRDEAHLVALGAAASAGRPVSDFPKPSAMLAIALLDRRPSPMSSYNYTPADHEDAVAGRSRLVYDIRLFDPRQGPNTVYSVIVDAHDGHLLQVDRQDFYPMSATKEPKASAPPFAPPAATRPWRVAEGDGPWSAPALTTLVPAPADGFRPARKLLLTDGKVAFQAGYDPATGRIALDGPDGKPQAYQPGPALAALLKRSPKN